MQSKKRRVHLKTYRELMKDAPAELTNSNAKVRTASINETTVDLPPNDNASERGFVARADVQRWVPA